MTSIMIELRGVSKEFRVPAGAAFTALDTVDLQIVGGEMVAVLGKSGSGKSTLLNLVAGLDRPSRGEVVIGGQSLEALREDALALWRGQNVGVIFQFFQLMPTLTILENVLLAMDFRGVLPKNQRLQRARHLLEKVGIADQSDKLPSTLSGGEQQRAAIARALANDPPLLLADEPTGNLDSKTATAVLDLFGEFTAEGKTLVMVTHDEEVTRRASRVVRLADGRIQSDTLTAPTYADFAERHA